MKIHIQDKSGARTISVPNWLLFNKLLLSGTVEIGGKGVRLTGLNRKHGEKLLAEAKRIVKQKGSWVLVEVQSADGTAVTIEV